MSITIVNIYDAANATTYTFGQYFTDVRNGPSKTLAADNATNAINSMANYWVSQHGGTYLGFVQDEGGFVINGTDGEVAMIYYVQELEAATEVNLADRIV